MSRTYAYGGITLLEQEIQTKIPFQKYINNKLYLRELPRLSRACRVYIIQNTC